MPPPASSDRLFHMLVSRVPEPTASLASFEVPHIDPSRSKSASKSESTLLQERDETKQERRATPTEIMVERKNEKKPEIM
jgi:hypothetical protein